MVGEEEPQLRPGSMWEHFHFHKHGKAFNHQFPVTKKEENQRKQTAKQRLLSFSPLSVSHAGICLACCSGRRSWHCMNKYLHINTQVILYKQLNRYLLERKCKLQSCTVTNKMLPILMGKMVYVSKMWRWFNDSSLCTHRQQNKFRSWWVYWFTRFNHMHLTPSWPLRLSHASDSFDHGTSLISSLVGLPTEFVRRIIQLSGHIPQNSWDLTLCLTGLCWIHQSAEAKLNCLVAVRNTKSQRRWDHLKKSAKGSTISFAQFCAAATKKVRSKWLKAKKQFVHKKRERIDKKTVNKPNFPQYSPNSIQV